MEDNTFTAQELLSVHRLGQKRGFVAGIIFCIGVKYLSDTRASKTLLVSDRV